MWPTVTVTFTLRIHGILAAQYALLQELFFDVDQFLDGTVPLQEVLDHGQIAGHGADNVEVIATELEAVRHDFGSPR